MNEIQAVLVAGLGGALIGGILALVGALVVVWVQRWTRNWGRIQCQLVDFRTEPAMKASDGNVYAAPENLNELDETGRSRSGVGELRIFDTMVCRIFNEKDQNTGLGDIRV